MQDNMLSLFQLDTLSQHMVQVVGRGSDICDPPDTGHIARFRSSSCSNLEDTISKTLLFELADTRDAKEFVQYLEVPWFCESSAFKHVGFLADLTLV